MDKVRISCILNMGSGGEDELLCYRIYIQARLRGGFWIWLEVTIDMTFLALRGERRHVFRNYYWQRKEHGTKQKKT